MSICLTKESVCVGRRTVKKKCNWTDLVRKQCARNAWAENNREADLEQKREWARKNKKAVKENLKAWRSNPENKRREAEQRSVAGFKKRYGEKWQAAMALHEAKKALNK